VPEKPDRGNAFSSTASQPGPSLTGLWPSGGYYKAAASSMQEYAAAMQERGGAGGGAGQGYERFGDAVMTVTVDGQMASQVTGSETVTTRELAFTFLSGCGLNPTPDAIDQLAEAFLPALRIICERGYDPEGATWRRGGWRGLLLEIDKKRDRLWHRSWLHSRFDPDSSLDGINYNGFYYRLKCSGMPWGTRGEPGSLGADVSPVSMGDYSDLTGQQ
jgi:hypothetical protein